jgi:hypothetical protein
VVPIVRFGHGFAIAGPLLSIGLFHLGEVAGLVDVHGGLNGIVVDQPLLIDSVAIAGVHMLRILRVVLYVTKGLAFAIGPSRGFGWNNMGVIVGRGWVRIMGSSHLFSPFKKNWSVIVDGLND